MSLSLEHAPVAVVCGGTAGIGLAAATALLQSGHQRVMIVGRNHDRAQSAAANLRARYPQACIEAMSSDVSQAQGAEAAMHRCVDLFGRIDTLVSCAGGDPMPRLVHETALEEIPEIIRSITSGVLLPLRAALPHMVASGGGSMISIASDAGKIATPGEAAIGAAMAAIAMFSRTLALEAKRHKIRVNCLTPSIVQGTPLYNKLMADPFAGRLFAKAHDRAQLGVVQAEDLADLIVFLASPGAARVTGQTISVTGGISAA
jgi:NAD(P)-dependent dehydrogenase (short-subunit alcohol dehydrogenase family)